MTYNLQHIISTQALLVRKHQRLGQSEHGCCFLFCVVSLLDALGCHTVTLRIDSFGWRIVTLHHRLGQSKRGCCFLLCVVSLLDSFRCQVVTLRNDSGEWDGGESLVFISALFSFCGEQNYTGNYERLVIC